MTQEEMDLVVDIKREYRGNIRKYFRDSWFKAHKSKLKDGKQSFELDINASQACFSNIQKGWNKACKQSSRQASKKESKQANKKVSNQVSRQVIKQASKQVIKQVSKQVIKQSSRQALA